VELHRIKAMDVVLTPMGNENNNLGRNSIFRDPRMWVFSFMAGLSIS